MMSSGEDEEQAAADEQERTDLWQQTLQVSILFCKHLKNCKEILWKSLGKKCAKRVETDNSYEARRIFICWIDPTDFKNY